MFDPEVACHKDNDQSITSLRASSFQRKYRTTPPHMTSLRLFMGHERLATYDDFGSELPKITKPKESIFCATCNAYSEHSYMIYVKYFLDISQCETDARYDQTYNDHPS